MQRRQLTRGYWEQEEEEDGGAAMHTEGKTEGQRRCAVANSHRILVYLGKGLFLVSGGQNHPRAVSVAKFSLKVNPTEKEKKNHDAQHGKRSLHRGGTFFIPSRTVSLITAS